jgi:hypothetical protein
MMLGKLFKFGKILKMIGYMDRGKKLMQTTLKSLSSKVLVH